MFAFVVNKVLLTTPRCTTSYYIALLSVVVASSAGERESKPGGFSATAAVEPTAKTTKTRDIDCRGEQQQQRFGDTETAE